MLAWLKSLTEDNKVKLMIVILGAVLAAAGYIGKLWFESTPQSSSDSKETITQTTSNDNSPTISNTKGDVTININSPRSEEQP